MIWTEKDLPFLFQKYVSNPYHTPGAENVETSVLMALTTLSGIEDQGKTRR